MQPRSESEPALQTRLHGRLMPLAHWIAELARGIAEGHPDALAQCLDELGRPGLDRSSASTATVLIGIPPSRKSTVTTGPTCQCDLAKRSTARRTGFDSGGGEKTARSGPLASRASTPRAHVAPSAGGSCSLHPLGRQKTLGSLQGGVKRFGCLRPREGTARAAIA